MRRVSFAARGRTAAAAGLLLIGLGGGAEAQSAGSRRDGPDAEGGFGPRRIEVYEMPSIRQAPRRAAASSLARTTARRPWWDIYDEPAALRRDLRAAWFLGVPVAGPSGYGAYGRLAGLPGRGTALRGSYASGEARTIRFYPRRYEVQRSWALRGN